MVYHQCGLFHAASSGLMLRLCSRTWNSWMVYHQFGLFHAASNVMCLCNHIGCFKWLDVAHGVSAAKFEQDLFKLRSTGEPF